MTMQPQLQHATTQCKYCIVECIQFLKKGSIGTYNKILLRIPLQIWISEFLNMFSHEAGFASFLTPQIERKADKQQLLATQCPVLYRTAPHCTALHHTAPHNTTLHHTAPHCTALHHTAPHCTPLHHTAHHTAPHCTKLLSQEADLATFSALQVELNDLQLEHLRTGLFFWGQSNCAMETAVEALFAVCVCIRMRIYICMYVCICINMYVINKYVDTTFLVRVCVHV